MGEQDLRSLLDAMPPFDDKARPLSHAKPLLLREPCAPRSVARLVAAHAARAVCRAWWSPQVGQPSSAAPASLDDMRRDMLRHLESTQTKVSRTGSLSQDRGWMATRP